MSHTGQPAAVRVRGFTFIEAAAVVAILVVLGVLAFLLSPPRSPRCRGHPLANTQQLRGIHQTMVIFSQDNNWHLPGLDSAGQRLPQGPQTGFSGDGATVAARFWIILAQSFLPAEILLHRCEVRGQMWTSGAVTSSMYSYGLLRIRNRVGDAGRIAEWRDNANSSVILMSDRNIGTGTGDSQVRSLWSKQPGQWEGSQVWGDNHGEYVTTHKGNKTRYAGVQQTTDSLFQDNEPGVTPGANALMTATR